MSPHSDVTPSDADTSRGHSSSILPPIDLFRPFMAPGVLDWIKPTVTRDDMGRIYCGQGPQVEAFESEFAAFLGLKQKPLSVNSCTSAITLALRLCGVGPKDLVVSTPMTCLSYLSPIKLSDGSTETIGRIVNQRLSPEVWTLNQKTGKHEIKRVTGWTKLPSVGVEWFRLRHKNGRACRGRGGKYGVWITGDHKVLTERGYVRVDALKPTDRVFTGQRKMSVGLRRVFDGMMLGDACLDTVLKQGSSRLSCLHSDRQREWVTLKESLFGDFGGHHREKCAYKQSGPSVGFQTAKCLDFRRQRERWYTHLGRKIVPLDLELWPETLATWYMDDGSYQSEGNVLFCCEGFENESVWRLFWKLHELGFHPRTVKRHSGNGLLLLRSELSKFFEIVSPYIIPSMRYKIPKDAPEYDASLWDDLSSEPDTDEVVVEAATPPVSEKTSSVYCLEVEDNHNFISGDMVLSNCTATNLPILNAGARILWADVDEHGLIDPDSARKLCMSHKGHVKAVMAVDWGGRMADYDMLKYCGVPIIQDAAHHITQPAGSYTCWSTQAIKHLTTGDGGFLLTPSEQHQRAKLLRWYGFDREGSADFRCAQDVSSENAGYKFHMNDIAASIGRANLQHLEGIIQAHRNNAKMLSHLIYNPRVILPKHDCASTDWWLYTIKVKSGSREDLMMHLKDRGVSCSQVHRRNDELSCFKDFRTKLPGLDDFSKRMLCIPTGWFLGPDDIQRVADGVNSWK